MSSSGMSLSMIRMYENMVTDKISPMIRVLEARSKSIEPMIRIKVKKEMGVYDLLLKKLDLQTQLKDIEESLKTKTKQQSGYVGGVWKTWTEVEEEVERRIGEVNAPLAAAKSLRDELVEKVRLSFSSSEMRTFFAEVAKVVEEEMKKISKLPPLEWKPSKEDKKLLALENVDVSDL